MNKIKRLLCFIGIHNWVEDKRYDSRNICTRCGMGQIVIKVIYEDDARKSGVSEEAIKRGYVTKDDFNGN